MDKKGFTLIELLATIVVIAIIMGLVLPSAARISRENKNKVYEEYESMMEEYALISKYKGQNIILLSELDELGKIKYECESGYVVRTSLDPLTYKAYVKCGEYTTDGYNQDVVLYHNSSDNLLVYNIAYYDTKLLSTDSCEINLNYYEDEIPSCDTTLISAPKKKGYLFDGWKSSVDNQIYNSGSVYTLTSNVLMTAQWKEVWAKDLWYNNYYTGFNCTDVQCAIVELYKYRK